MKLTKSFFNFLKEHAISLYLFAFIIPLYPKWLGYGILVIFLENLIKRNFRNPSEYKEFFNFKKGSFWLFIFYLIHLLGMSYSENTSFGWMDIGIKASFAIFPIIFLFFNPKINLSTFLKCFVLGALISIVLCYYLSYLVYQETGQPWHFREMYLSHFMHRSYWATYLVLAFIFSVYLLIIKKINIFIGFFLTLIFFILVFITGSKAGIIAVILSTVFLFIYLIRINKMWKWGFLLAIISVLLLTVTLNYFPSVKDRIVRSYQYATGDLTIDVDKTESTASRLLLWETSIELIKEKPFIGVGTGDVKDVLIHRNYDKGYIGIAEKKLNAHNQFLNTWIALGLIGFITLLFSFLSSFLYPFKEHVFLQRITIFVLFISLVAESFLETQAGIIPVAFFLTLLSSLGVGKGSLLTRV